MKKIILTIVWVLAGLYARAQTISTVEYFFDADPGYSNGTSVSTPVGSELTNFIFDVPVTGVGEGFHVLSIRILDSDGAWSTVTKRTIFKMPAVTGLDPVFISTLEYFFDADPGYGSGTLVTVDPNSSTANLVFDIPLGALSNGFHILSVRAKSSNGTWSSIYKRTVFKVAEPTGVPDLLLTNLEYFIDTDPGYGNGFEVPFTPATDLSNLMFDVSVSGLSEGTHKLYVRAMDAGQIWSTIQTKTLTVCNAPAPVEVVATNVSSNAFTASWSAVQNATGYQLDVSLDDFTTFLSGYNGKSTANLTEVVSSLTAATSYIFRVRAVGSCTSVNSDEITVETLPIPPNAPTCVAGSFITADGFIANWDAAPTATSYRLDVSVDNFVSFLSGYDNLQVIGLTETLAGLTPGTTYSYRVRAENIAGSSPSSNVISVTTLKANQLITFDPLDDVVFGSQPFELVATSDSGLPITFTSDNANVATVIGATITVHNAGSATISASQDGNDRYNVAVNVDQILTVNKAAQAIAFGAIAAHGIGEGTFQLTASSSSGLAVAYSSSDLAVATISGNIVTLVAPGIVDITASQTGNDNYEAATDVTRMLTINEKSAQTITFDPLNDVTFGDNSFNLNATASSGLSVGFTSSDATVVTLAGNVATIIGAGTVTITASQSGNNLYATATPVTQVLTVKKASQQITFSALPPHNVDDGTFTITATAGSGQTVLFSSSNPTVATVAGNTISLLSTGTTDITATQGGNNNYLAAAPVVRTLIVFAKANQTITFPVISDKTLGDAQFDVSASSTSLLTVSFTTSSDKISITGSTVTLVKAGRTTITANQDGDEHFHPATPVDRDFCINPVKPVITSTGTIDAPLLTSSETTGNEWFLNGTAIGGATNQTFTVNAEGSYTVQSKVDDCVSAMSSAKPFVITGISRINDDVLVAYPNPARKELVVRWGATFERHVTMLDLLGRQHESKQISASEVTFNVENLPAGTYLLKGVGNNSVQYFRFTKE
jgi:hypothetical protein